MDDETPLPPEGDKPRQIRIKGPRRKPMTRDEAHVAIGMKVAGFPDSKIAKAFGNEIAEHQIYHTLQRIPNLYEQITVYRENLKLRKMKRMFDANDKLWNRIDSEIPKGTAKDIDALFRAAHAAEKMEASVAGEAQKVDIQQPAAPNVDLKVLIQTLGLEGLKDLTK